PDTADNITIDCSCTVTINADLVIDGSLTIALGTTLDLGGNNLEIGEEEKSATLTNHGTITNGVEIKVKGGGEFGEGPFITNTGVITTQKIPCWK
ncbi:MAG: hypothetical protein KAI99_15390, partial [Cyclobacteriaceae bacterium]|nr:hypothetical protein [Cyclobacteriaceae bacterium]